MMLTTIQTAFTTALTGLGLFKDVGLWQGDLDAATQNPARLPAAWILFTGARYGAPRTIGATVAPAELGFAVVVVCRNLAGPGKGTAQSYELVEQVVAALTRLNTGFGQSWPDGVELVTVDNGIAAYAVSVTVKTNP